MDSCNKPVKHFSTPIDFVEYLTRKALKLTAITPATVVALADTVRITQQALNDAKQELEWINS